MDFDSAKKMLVQAHSSGFNTIQLTLSDGVRLKHAPWKAQRDAWTKSQLIEWSNLANSLGMEVIPQLALLTHQQKFFQNNYPELMYSKGIYDPRNEQTYVKVFAVLQEVIDIFHPKAIHIGHDEVAGWILPATTFYKKDRRIGLGKGEEVFPAELFLDDVLKVHDFLKKRHVETWMWGDMLISDEEFPHMMARDLHGEIAPGYGGILRHKLPKDIVICDWHYGDEQRDFPSLKVFHDEGFRVVGSTFIKEKTITNFSHYAKRHGAIGMMATTWYFVQRKEWDKVNRIIQFSGETFLRDFPDEK
ncbi:MAG: hypothetical protein CO186_09060 [Zetaproteobacteria bacterium CG_4_9_14_3_um_filter_49_83]|nr:MAG: hypothetical protein CO186_09060 [Zetaproteobacteria bacterium CG_4_9_14_3_um_filter_49_83]